MPISYALAKSHTGRTEEKRKYKNQEEQQNHTNRSEILICLKPHDFYRPTHHMSVSFHIEPKTA